MPILCSRQRRQVELEDKRPIVAAKHEKNSQTTNRSLHQIIEKSPECCVFVVFVEDEEFFELINHEQQGRVAPSASGIRSLSEKIIKREVGVSFGEPCFGGEEGLAKALGWIAEKPGLDHQPASIA